MKHVFSILLLCIIFQNVLTARRSLKMRMTKVAQALKLILDSKEKKLRKLQNTDVITDTEAGETPSSNQTETLAVDTITSTDSTSSTDTTTSADSTSSADSTTAEDSTSSVESTTATNSTTAADSTSSIESTAAADTTSSGETSSANQTETETSAADSTSSADSTTNSTSGAITDTSVQTSLPVENYTDSSPADAPESANATAANAEVPVSKPVAVTPKTTGNSNAAVQVTKFHGFKSPRNQRTWESYFWCLFLFCWKTNC